MAEPLSLEQKVKIRGTKLYAEGEILMRLIEDAGPFAGQIVG